MHDSHTHLAISPLKENLDRAVSDFFKDNGKKILCVSADLEEIQDTLEYAQIYNSKYPNIIDIGLGIHPTIYEEKIIFNKDTDIFTSGRKIINHFKDQFQKNISNPYLKAVGETGLDYYQMNQGEIFSQEQKEQIKEIQKMSLREHIQIALENNLPLSIHARELQGETECVKDTLTLLAQEGKGQLRGSFHSYTGEKSMLKEILSLGFYVGFNPIITYPSGESVRELLKEVPLDRILLETDGPFLPTQKTRKNNKAEFKFGRPSDVREVIEVIATIKGVKEERLEELLDENYTSLFGK